METFYILLVGFLLGLKHALDPDHLVAVSAMVSRHKNPVRSAIAGLFWGIGHTSALLLAAIVILILGVTVPASLERWFEFLVGLVLMWLGISVVRRAVSSRLHIHGHKHSGRAHVHFHTHESEERHVPEHAHEHRRSILVGMTHGLAGSAAFMLVLVSQVESMFAGIIYVAVFGLGSILGMMIFGGIISLPLRASTALPRFNASMRFAVGVASLALGLMIIAQNWP